MKICRLQFKLLVSLSVCLFSGLLLFARPTNAAEVLFFDTLDKTDNYCCGLGDWSYWQIFQTDVGSINQVSHVFNDSRNDIYIVLTNNDTSETLYTTIDNKVNVSSGLYTWNFDSIPLSSGVNYKIQIFNKGNSVYYQSSGTMVEGAIQMGIDGSYAPGGLASPATLNLGLGYDDTYGTGYCGDGICNGTETDTTCIDCLTFYDMTTLEDTYLWFDKTIEYCPINSSCAIKYHFDTDIFNPATDYGKLYYYESSTSTPDYLGNITPLATGWELGDLDGGRIIASSTATSTHFSYYKIVPCQTFGSGGCWGTSTVAVWFSPPPDYEEIISGMWVATSSTSTSDMVEEFNLTAYNLTCSAEQWAGDWWTKIGCYFRFGEVVLQNRASQILSNVMSRTWSSLKNMFPFNFANLMNTSWKAATISGVPSDLAFLDMLDDEGNISFDFSAMTGATTTLTFWGANTFNNTNGEFTKVRSISKYVFYGLLFLYIYLKGKHVYNELSGNNSTEND